jgi:hypothetical protein
MVKNDSDPPARELGDGSANLLFDHARRGARWTVSCIVRQTFCIAYTTASSLYLSRYPYLMLVSETASSLYRLRSCHNGTLFGACDFCHLWSGWENQAAMLTSDADDDGT